MPLGYTFPMTEARPSLLLPLAILAAGAVLAGAIYVVRTGEPVSPLLSVGAARPVSLEDHSVGSPDAPVVIITYSDIDCAYCKEFQATMASLMTEYAEGGRVAWVYRHFPVLNINPNAASHAEAAECVGEQGGDIGFFSFIDALQQRAPGSLGFSPSGYGPVVGSLGFAVDAFDACMAGDRLVERVTLDFENAVAAGGQAAPYTIVLAGGAEPVPITGAVPYAVLKEVVERALAASGAP